MTQPVSTSAYNASKIANRKAAKQLTDCEMEIGMTAEQARAWHQEQRRRILEHGLRKAA